MSRAGSFLQGGVDGAGELSFEAADGFASALAFGLFALEVGACGRVARGAWVIAMRCRAQLSWRLPPRSRRCRRCLPELASSGATPAWRASWRRCGSVRSGRSRRAAWRRSTAPQPGSVEQRRRGLRACAVGSSRSSSRIVRVEAAAARRASSRAIRTCVVCSSAAEPSREPVEPDRPVERAQRHRAAAGSSSCRCQRSRCCSPRGARRRGRRGDRPAASAHAALLTRPRADRAAAPAALPWRPRARRSRPTCRASGRARRCGAISFGGTRTSRSPAASSVRSSARVTLPAVLERPQPLRRRATPPSRAAPGASPTGSAPPARRPTSSTATAVSECLCTSTPITIIRDRLLQRWGRPASGQSLTRGSCQAPIRSRSTVSGRRRRHNAGKSALRGDIRESSQPPPTRVCVARPDATTADDDSEFGNVPRVATAEDGRAGAGASR